MPAREHLIAGIQKQQAALLKLIRDFEAREVLTAQDCRIYQQITREVEIGLKKLRKVAADELIKEVRPCSVNPT